MLSMRVRLRPLGVLLSVASVVYACGGGAPRGFSEFAEDLEDAGAARAGEFVVGDSTAEPTRDCKALTCADVEATCGLIGDGCGGVVDCGGCPDGQTCGGGGTPSQCGAPACAKLTCAELDQDCGPAGDGCGGTIASCGACGPGEFCGGGGPSKCGSQLAGGADGGGACVPFTCADVGANCGPVSDGCGGLIDCGTCNAAAGETCGGAGTPSQCGRACKPLTACPPGLDCGPVADGCGGVVSCGAACPAGEICGGGGVANVCGNNGGPPCTGLCEQQAACPGGGTTSVSGTVFAPNGQLPIYGALVYVPNAAVAPFAPGVTCEQCGAASGEPLVSTTTGPDGRFWLANVPVSSAAPGKVNDIPIVIQLGRWRKQLTVRTTACGNTVVAPSRSSLPKNKAEGDIPLTAIVTGDVDALECVFRKLGIDDAEFTNPSGDGRIRLYQDNGAVITAAQGRCSRDGSACTNFGGSCRFNRGTCNRTSAGTPPATDLYNSPAELDKYDMTIFACRGSEVNKPVSARMNLLNYANKGGRVYATHYSYVWLYDKFSTAVPNPPPWGAAGAPFPWATTADFSPANGAQWRRATASLDTSFPKGVAFAQWLSQPAVGGLLAPLPASPPPYVPAPQINIDEARHDVDEPVFAGGQAWLRTTTDATPEVASVQHFTFNTDTRRPPAQQCGRVLYSDFHVTANSATQGKIFPAECNDDPMTAQEKVLAFMLFDLASCIDAVPPEPPTCTPKSCAAQGIECGQAGDGCGNVITCPDCPAGMTCGGGGVASKCGKPACAPRACAPNQCGRIADGCGGSIECPPCAPGEVCGAGGANMCGTGTCNPMSCPAPARGSACGAVADGCGGLNACACPPGMPCVNGTCGAPPCTPRTCEEAGAQCGDVADGCGGITHCPPCVPPQTCGGGGTPNVCGGGGVVK